MEFLEKRLILRSRVTFICIFRRLATISTIRGFHWCQNYFHTYIIRKVIQIEVEGTLRLLKKDDFEKTGFER